MTRPSRITLSTPTLKAASRLLKPHLDAVALLSSVPARTAAAETTQIHDLRVSCRRAAAALLIFEPVLKGRKVKRFMRAMQNLRRTAGPLRDNSVMLRQARSRARARPELGPAARYLTTVLTARRHDQTKALAEFTGRAPSRKLRALADDLLHSLTKADPKARLGGVVATVLAAAAQRVRDAADADLTQLENLHRLRRRVKTIRFIAEVLSPVHAPYVRSLHSRALEVSGTLGAVNDLHLLVRLLEKETPKATATPGAVGKSLSAMLARATTDLDSLADTARSVISGPTLRRLLDEIPAPGADRP